MKKSAETTLIALASVKTASPCAENAENPSEACDEGELITIGALANLCGVTVRALRYYEEVDLIGPVKRSSGKYRLYNDSCLKRVQAIIALQNLNYSLEEILDVLGPYSKSAEYSKHERIRMTRRSIETQRDLINSKLKLLKQLKKDLDTRLEVIDNICEGCLVELPTQNCQDSCEHRDVHLS